MLMERVKTSITFKSIGKTPFTANKKYTTNFKLLIFWQVKIEVRPIIVLWGFQCCYRYLHNVYLKFVHYHNGALSFQ